MIRLLRNLAQDHDPSKSNILNPKRSSENTLFEETSYRAIKIAQRRKWTLIGLIASVSLIGLGFIIYNQVLTSKNQKLSEEYTSIEKIFNQESLEYQKKLEVFKGNPPKDLTADNSKSMELFSQFAKKYDSFPIGWQAAIRAATYFINKGFNDKAKEILEPLVSKTGRQPLLQIQIRTSLAGIYTTEKNDQKALSELKIVEEISQNPLPNQARLLRAQILFLSGNKEEALKILNQIISTNDSSSNSASQASDIQQQAKIWLNYLES